MLQLDKPAEPGTEAVRFVGLSINMKFKQQLIGRKSSIALELPLQELFARQNPRIVARQLQY